MVTRDSLGGVRFVAAVQALLVLVACLGASLGASNAVAAGNADNPLFGSWRFDHVQPLAEQVDESNLRRVRAMVAPLQTIEVHFGADQLTLTKPGGKTTSYPVDYRIDRSAHTVTMIEHREQQTVKQTYHLMPDKPELIYTKREFGPVGRVRMIYKRAGQD
ncbi:hypothetical protein [Salinisphaera orenii]|uniref:hypothetical protein n=1 Tax=Salinisphaera orenii TaxID=856731 RepID=UPI000DBEA966